MACSSTQVFVYSPRSLRHFSVNSAMKDLKRRGHGESAERAEDSETMVRSCLLFAFIGDSDLRQPVAQRIARKAEQARTLTLVAVGAGAARIEVSKFV